ncbi:ATP-binding protein [Halosimplex sp. TS25]|uniref:ATP-binding protein n=1 Tax=Halosimplex rarum TaxID=3396619 RepID=UPI0039EB9D0F
MTLVGTIAAVGLDVTAVALLGRTTWGAAQARDRPSARPFVALLAGLTLWAGCLVVSELPVISDVSPVSTAVVFTQIGIVLLLPGVWTVYVLSYTGRGTGLTRWRVLMFVGIALPVVGAAVAIAVGLADGGPSVSAAEGVLASLLATEMMYLFALICYATYLLLDLARNHDRVSLPQIAVPIAAVSAPYLAGAAGGEGIADGLTVGLLLSGGLFAVAVRRYPLLTGFPKADYVARTRVVEALQEAVVVVDWDGRVLDANATAAELFDTSPEAMIGEPIRSVADGLEGTDLSADATGRVALGTTKGRRQFRFSVSAVDDADAADDGTDPVARAVLFRDVTDRRTREQRLAVLNRVLRHNVRNELDVVLAHADRVDDDGLRAGIRDSATDLVALSKRAREAEDVMTAATGAPESVDLAEAARTVVERYRTADRDGDVSLTCPDELVVTSHRRVLEEVLSELVDNALTHAGDSPRVEIGVRSGPETVAELTVADDGPGIPERERRVVDDGTETQFEHGRGLGLWFVNWAVTQLGGDLEFAENDPRGSVVTVRLYGVESVS